MSKHTWRQVHPAVATYRALFLVGDRLPQLVDKTLLLLLRELDYLYCRPLRGRPSQLLEVVLRHEIRRKTELAH